MSISMSSGERSSGSSSSSSSSSSSGSSSSSSSAVAAGVAKSLSSGSSSSTASTGAAAGAGRGAAVALRLGEQRRQRAGQGVDLMRVQRRAVGELGLVVGEHALEAEHERVAPPPARRGDLLAGVDLPQRGVERAAPGGSGRERVLRGFTCVHEGLARELLRALDVGRLGNGRGNEGHWRGISQSRLPARNVRWTALTIRRDPDNRDRLGVAG